MNTFISLHNHPTGAAVYLKSDELAYLLDTDGNVIDTLDAETLDEILRNEDENE